MVRVASYPEKLKKVTGKYMITEGCKKQRCSFRGQLSK